MKIGVLKVGKPFPCTVCDDGVLTYIKLASNFAYHANCKCGTPYVILTSGTYWIREEPKEAQKLDPIEPEDAA